ncbi:glycosyltransferase [Flectobacillus rivi]|uniref:Glycosyltransferase n=1 Tax=Flectobacillus rivi TaxID=2984209 RepID=A0ABT6YX06_9BACT|nr:glycosyltransferase [Flectobacillus rivi]MDI9873358.1 glycosyltransferase [Flectobacillus rivi]
MSFKNLSTQAIALIIPDFDFGGEEKRVLFFVNNYVNHFKEVFLFAPNGKSAASLDKRVKHIIVETRKYKNIFRIIKSLKDNNITFLQGHKRATLPYLVAAEKLLGIKSCFNFDNIYLNNGVSNLLMPKTIIYLSDILKAHYLPFFPNHDNKVINMGGDFLTPIEGDDIENVKIELGIKNKFTILSLGRLSSQKNQKMLVEALTIIADIDFKVLFVGEGPLENALKNMCLEMNLLDKVQFLGHRKDVNVLLSISDALVQSSIFEGFPNVFIEATSLGIPIIATNVGSSKTLVQDNGILIESGDTSGLANAIKKMAQNLERYKLNAILMKESDFFKQFHKSVMLNGYLSHYASSAL